MIQTSPSYDYDVFISYSHQDQAWVRSDLLKKLEDKRLKVCIDFRDFEAGAPSVTEMRRAVVSSRKTLLVITSKYLESAWAEFEMLMIQTLDPANRQRRLIPIRREECKLPVEIGYLTYVDLVDPDDSDIEWKKLLSALGQPLFQPLEPLPPPPPPLSPDVVDDTSRSAREGIEALIELMDHPIVQADVATFEAIFQTSCKQIDVLAYYKDLHDLLHTLQFKCYNYIIGIVRNAKKSPDDPSVWDNVFEYELTLQDIVDGLKRFAAQETTGQNMCFWIQGLIEALNRLFRATENCDAQQIEAAVRPISRVLAIQPVIINTRLNEAARALPLPPLVGALTRIHNNLGRTQVRPDTVGKFKDGVAALGKLNDKLTSLIEDHDKWQAIDVELRRIEATINLDSTELVASWSDLKEMVHPQCSGVAEPWAGLLFEDSQKLDDAMRAQDPNRIKQYFGRYRTRVSNRFYQVDLTLKGLCGKLRSVGEPLATVLEMI
jgi:hypothetical protein